MSYLVDTSIWIDHFHKNDAKLQELLDDQEVFIHPLILIELALGQIKNRKEVLGFLNLLPKSLEASFDEALYMIEKNKLFGLGIGAIDLQILSSSKLSNVGIYTRDQSMLRAMKSLKIQGIE